MNPLSTYGTSAYRRYVLFLLMLVYVLTTIDRGIIMALIEPIKRDIALSDSEAGILIGPAFAVFFLLAGVPLGRLADHGTRRTVVSLCLFAWSAMTALCGMANSFLQLAIGRVGVGIGEAGGPPAAVAIISDIFPPERRGSAQSFFYAGASIGVMISFGAGGWIAAHYGWRTAFYAAAVPGILLAIMIRLTVREPLRGLSEGRIAKEGVTPLREALRYMGTQRSLLHLMAGLTLCQAVGAGGMSFFVSYLLRSQAMSLADASLAVALCYGIGATLGMVGFGTLADVLAVRHGVKWRSRIPAASALLSLLCFCGIVLAGSVPAAIAFLAAWSVFCVGFAAPSYALLQSLVRPDMRATMGAIQFIVMAVIGGSIGPVVVGAGSDLLRSTLGSESLRFALLILPLLYVWALLHFLRAEHDLEADLQRNKH